jgi:hypothetical protein
MAAEYQQQTRYAVKLKVRPKPTHPRYWSWRHGVLVIVLDAENALYAEITALHLVDGMPFETVPFPDGGHALTVLFDEREKAMFDKHCCQGAAQMMADIGFCYMLLAVPLDEENASDSDVEKWGAPV